jgi:predicted SnoaL-like aldol condensation-catalyzing enzyme
VINVASPDGADNALMQRYMDDLLAGRRETFPSYFNGTEYVQHNLFRIESGKIAEHWDTLEAIPARDQWKNSNGKF